MELYEQMMFFNSCFIANLQDIDNDIIEKEILGLKINNPETVYKSNNGGWQSNSLNYDSCGKEIKKVIDACNIAVEALSNEYSIDKNISLGNFWANINEYKDSNLPHAHPGSVFSASYYVKCNESSGDIVFSRPDLQQHYLTVKEYNRYNYGKYIIHVKPSQLVIFPSYLEHYVEPNMSNDTRISIAFNYY